jgi:hypothetical protein
MPQTLDISDLPAARSAPRTGIDLSDIPDVKQPTLLDRAVTTGLRIVPAIGGGIVGGLLGAPTVVGGPLGAAAGGATGSAAGETAAEWYEVQRGLRRKLNPTQIAVQGALGAVPVVGKAGSVLKTAALRGGQGAVMGGVADVATNLAEGETPTLAGAAKGAAVGAVLGAPLGAVESKLASRAANRAATSAVPAVKPLDISDLPPAHVDNVSAQVDKAPAAGLTKPPSAQQELPLHEPSAPVRTSDEKFDALARKQLEPEPKTPITTSVKGAVTEARRHFVNRFEGLEQWMKEGGVDTLNESASTNPVKQLELATGGSAGRIQAASDRMRQVVDDARDAGLEKELTELLNLNALEAGAQTLSQRAAGEGADALAAGKALPEGIVPEDIAARRAKWETRTDLDADQKIAVQGLANRVFEANRKALEDVVDAGLITPEVAKELRERAERAAYDQRGGYAPLSRIMDEVTEKIRGNGSNLDMPTQHVLAQLNGSERTTQHPLVASLTKQATALQEAARNRALKSLVDLRHRDDYFGSQIIPIKEGAPLPKGTGFITVFEAGQPQRYAVPEVLATALKSGDGPTTNVLVQALQASGNIFRTGTTTANLSFAVPNVLRDVSDLAVMGGKNRVIGALDPRVWASWAKAWKDVVSKSPDYIEFLDSGAAFSTFQRNVSGMKQALDIGVSKPGVVAKAGKAVRAGTIGVAEKINNSLEEATKLSAFRTFTEQAGGDAAEAAWKTRRFGGSPDFARRGASTTELNNIVPFLNAQIQGLDRIAAFAKSNPRAAMTAAAAATAQLALLQGYNNSYRDPDGTRSWDRISTREKQQNWIVLIPGTFRDAETGIERQRYLKIPAGHTVNLIRGPIQALLDPQTRNLEDVSNSALANLPMSPQFKSAAPLSSARDSVISGLNPLLRVPIEEGMNKDTFRDQPIVSRRLEGASPEEQFTDSTSVTARALGGTFGASPQRIEHAMRGAGGGLADVGLSMADSLSPDAKKMKPVTDIPGLKQASEVPVVGGVVKPIVRRFVGGPASIDEVEHRKKERFYSALRQSQQAIESLRLMRSRGETAKVEAFLADPKKKQLASMAGRLNTIAQRAAALRRGDNFKGEQEVITAIDKVLTDLGQ